MTHDFEGRTEKEAIEKAMLELGLERDNFDVEILEAQRGGIFKKGYVKIRLHTDEAPKSNQTRPRERNTVSAGTETESEGVTNSEFEKKLVDFMRNVLEKMGTPGNVIIQNNERRKIVLEIQSADSAIIIGRKGRTLDALQLIATLYAKQIKHTEVRVMIDCEQYRKHHEEKLVRLAWSVAGRVRSQRRSYLMEPMNPSDRRLIHTTLDKESDLETKSEGDGTYKQIRVIYKHRR
jgi:spoIIIJ-associated protein